jgi:hypothetical protein
MSDVRITCRSITIYAVPIYWDCKNDSYTFDEGVTFRMTDTGDFSPILRKMVIDPGWFQSLKRNHKALRIDGNRTIYVNSMGDTERREWRFSDRLHVTIHQDKLVFDAEYEELINLFGGRITFND